VHVIQPVAAGGLEGLHDFAAAADLSLHSKKAI
jgi:hypothetical protein